MHTVIVQVDPFEAFDAAAEVIVAEQQAGDLSAGSNRDTVRAVTRGSRLLEAQPYLLTHHVIAVCYTLENKETGVRNRNGSYNRSRIRQVCSTF